MFYDNNYYNNKNHCSNFSEGAFYSLFAGLNDKYKGAQIIPTTKAVTFAQYICKKYFINGFTILVGSGADRGSSSGIETSIYIMAINATKDSVFRVASALKDEFNISEILIEKNSTQYLYYTN